MSNENREVRKGLIFDIQRFSVHDGPGIRTTVFLKGCPLRCRWCSNPESWNPFPELMAYDSRCRRCGKCVPSCPQGAITLNSEQGRKIDWSRCNLCLRCTQACPHGALSRTGRYMSLEEVMAEVRSDRLFYQNSGGGVTLSGGEPLLQWEFATEVLKACKQEGIHTALDTCGYARREVLDHVLEFVDLLLYDIKHLNPEHHRWGTGKSNLLILENARMAAPMIRVWLRFPLIPGYNDAEENLRGLGELAVGLGVEKISLLPYHKAGELKYKRLGRKFPFRLTEPPGERHIQEAKRFLETFGVEVTVGN